MAENRFKRFVEDTPAPERKNRFSQYADRPTRPAEPERDGNRGTTAFLNRGIATTLGAPVDLVNRGLGAVGVPVSDRPFLGSEMIADTMGVAGIRSAEAGAQPDTLGEYIGRGMGEAAGALPGFFGVTGAMTGPAARIATGPGQSIRTAVPSTAGASTVTQGAGQSMQAPFVSSPGRAFRIEAGAGAGAGAAAYGFDEVTQTEGRGGLGRTLAEFGGAIAGGAGPGALYRTARATPVAGTVIRGAQKAVAPFTRAGATERARDRVRSLAEDPVAARQALLEEPPLRGPDGEQLLSPAQRTGDRRLMALEQAVRDSDPPMDLAMRQQDARADAAFRDALREPGAGQGAEAARGFISRRMDARLRGMDTQIQQAQDRAQRKIADLTPQRRASESSQIVRNELETALRRARREESALWQQVPDNVQVPTSETRAAYRALVETTPRAQQDNIPAKARAFLDPDQSNQAFGATETVKEMRGLYSEMREFARTKRAAGERNAARMADDIADGILRDFDATEAIGDAGRLFGEARAFSRQLNDKFTRGSIGRVLGSAREGGASLPAELTLDRTIGQPGLRAAVSADELRAAVGDSPDAISAAQDYITRRFTDHSIRNGQFNTSRAQDFVRNNSELLDRFPALKQRMANAEQAQTLATETASRLGQRASRLRDPKVSYTARFLNAPVDQEISALISARDPRTAALELRRQAAQDPTGNALAGLKGAFVDHVMDRARMGQFNELGEPLLSGRAIRATLRDDKISKAARGILSNQERVRLERLAQELSKLETARSNLPSVGGVVDDMPNQLISFIGRTIAARSGARMGQGVSGASLLTAGFASKRMQRLLSALTNDHAEALIREAVRDPVAFRTLLADPRTITDPRTIGMLESIVGFTGTQVGGAMDEDERPPLELTVTPRQDQ